MTAMHRYPGSNRLMLHPNGGRAARTARTLAGSSDWRRRLADRAGSGVVAITGPRLWPIAPPWRWPALSPEEIESELGNVLPGLRLLGAATPRQSGRTRLSLLCRYAGNPIVVKLGVDESGATLHTEAEVLALLMKNPLPGIVTPHVIASGQIPTTAESPAVQFIATTTVGLGTQRPALDVALRTFEADLGNRLRELPSAQAGLVPVHGDLTPWNLRRTGRGLALFDWESAGWGQPGSDVAAYRAACDEIRPRWKSRSTASRRRPDR